MDQHQYFQYNLNEYIIRYVIKPWTRAPSFCYGLYFGIIYWEYLQEKERGNENEGSNLIVMFNKWNSSSRFIRTFIAYILSLSLVLTALLSNRDAQIKVLHQLLIKGNRLLAYMDPGVLVIYFPILTTKWSHNPYPNWYIEYG